MKDKMILKDGTGVELESGASLGNMQVVFSDKASMVETWDKFTDENLKTVQITDGNGAVIAEYTDLLLVSVSTEKEDGTILTTFALREKTKLELDVEELKKDMAAINEVMGG